MIHRVFFFVLLALAVAGRAEPFRPAPRDLGGSPANQAEGRKALEEFRTLGLRGVYWLQFELRVMPRKGAERSVRGQLYGTRDAQGPLTRLAVAEGGARAPTHRWLIRSGAEPAAWSWTVASHEVKETTSADALKPVAGTDLTLFDLQMPFLYWSDFVYEGLGKVRGRPAHSFLLYPPALFAGANPAISAVRVALDTQFGALMQAEVLGPKGEPLKSITVLDVKKAGEQWVVKSIDLRNHETRDKTRLTVTAAAFDLSMPPALFQPDGLLAEPAGVPEGAVRF